MATVEFLAFPGYVRKVLRRNEPDEQGDNPLPGPGARCRLWSKSRPSAIDWDNNQTYLLDLAAHPDPNPNFASSDVNKFQCDAPGLTKVGDGAGSGPNGPFDVADDYINRVYLANSFWGKIPDMAKPSFPCMTTLPIPERMLPNNGPNNGLQDYELKIIIYSNDDADVPRRNHRYVGRYAEVVSLVGGTVWNVNVFKFGSGAKVSMPLDFNNHALYGGATEIIPTPRSHGALYLDYPTFTAMALDLPKLPASQGHGILFERFGESAPTLAEIGTLISRRGNW